jgi:hypothetical protein
MERHERVGWVVLWGGVTAMMAVFFYELVAKPTL